LPLTIIQNHDNANGCNIGQCEDTHRKYKRLKLVGSQTYNCSSDYDALVA